MVTGTKPNSDVGPKAKIRILASSQVRIVPNVSFARDN